MNKRALLLAAFMLLPATAIAGENDERYGTYTLLLENDSFTSLRSGLSTDRHYTHGTRLTWLSPADYDLGLVGGWADAFPLFPDGGAKRLGIAMGQNIYTPADISRRDLVRNDRPYAGWLYGALAVTSDATVNIGTDEQPRLVGRLDTLELNVGVVGPQAYASEAQTEIHKLINSPLPQGWNNQLRNEPGIVLFYERKWRNVARADFLGLDFDLTPHVAGSAGNVFTYAGLGAAVRIGDGLTSDYGPPRIRPGLSGAGFFTKPPGGLTWYLFAGVEGRAVARDIFLDGNTFAKSHSVDKEPLVGDLQAGFAVIVDPVRITYSQIFRTREFVGQPQTDRFAALSISFKF
ncbi:MAG: lipid A deacylase LpxR family protein [Rhodospirillales bacterium]|nr:lipid A deacylase LpxR family protein [Rhodospirillales bacterium]